MDFSAIKPARRNAENIVPMINIVFLLLIFFLMSAQIAPPAPADIQAPASAADASPGQIHGLYLTADGDVFYAGLSGTAAWDALATDTPDPLTVHVDSRLPAAEFARLMRRFGNLGLTRIDIITRGRE